MSDFIEKYNLTEEHNIAYYFIQLVIEVSYKVDVLNTFSQLLVI